MMSSMNKDIAIYNKNKKINNESFNSYIFKMLVSKKEEL